MYARVCVCFMRKLACEANVYVSSAACALIQTCVCAGGVHYARFNDVWLRSV